MRQRPNSFSFNTFIYSGLAIIYNFYLKPFSAERPSTDLSDDWFIFTYLPSNSKG
jgi:hypothetical protein